MTKREEFDEMIEKVGSGDYTKEELLIFLGKHAPKNESRKRLPCTCGCKTTYMRWHMTNECWFIECGRCNAKAPSAKTSMQAIRNWNEMVRKEKESKSRLEQTT